MQIPEPKKETKISANDVIKQAFRLTYGMKWAFFWMGIITPVILIPILMMVVMKVLLFIILPYSLFDVGGFFIKAMYVVLQWYLLTILIVLGARQALGLPLVVPLAFRECMRSKGRLFFVLLILTLGYLLTSYCANYFDFYQYRFLKIGIFIPFFYLMMLTLTFVVPLIALNDLNFKNAFIDGFKRLNNHLVPITLCWLFLLAINLACTLMPPLQIGLIWFVPMLFAMIGVLFRDAFGVVA